MHAAKHQGLPRSSGARDGHDPRPSLRWALHDERSHCTVLHDVLADVADLDDRLPVGPEIDGHARSCEFDAADGDHVRADLVVGPLLRAVGNSSIMNMPRSPSRSTVGKISGAAHDV